MNHILPKPNIYGQHYAISILYLYNNLILHAISLVSCHALQVLVRNDRVTIFKLDIVLNHVHGANSFFPPNSTSGWNTITFGSQGDIGIIHSFSDFDLGMTPCDLELFLGGGGGCGLQQEDHLASN